LAAALVNAERPPRVRLEWLIATARVVIASSGFITFVISPLSPVGREALNMALGWYVVYSFLVLAMVWAPARFATGWDVAVHCFDLIAFSVLLLMTAAESSPFYVYFIFLVVCGTLRWQWWGALWTAVVAILVYGAVSWYAVTILGPRAFEWNALVIRSVNVGVVAVLVGYLGAYQHRHQREVGQLASWPRKIPADDRALISEILNEASKILDSPRVLLAWEEPGDGCLNLAALSDGAVVRHREKNVAFDSIVLPTFRARSFSAADAADAHGVVLYGSGNSFKQRRCSPIHASIQQRFQIHSVQSWLLDGEIIRGRLLCLDRTGTRVDDLMFGEVVARHAVSRLDSLHLLKRLQEAAAVDERLRLARELHDSLLQSVAGSAMQLLAARRLLDAQPDAAREQLKEVQAQLERGELEMRSFIGGLRPLPLFTPIVGVALRQRLDQLRQRIEREWDIKVKMNVAPDAEDWPETIATDVYRLVQEAMLNAARHADASLIEVGITAPGGPCIEVTDDGHGFPFQGNYDLRALNEMKVGPLTLRERVADLHGDLHLKSSDSGTGLLIRLPAVHGVT
jgi:signal transduction histidine kinase